MQAYVGITNLILFFLVLTIDSMTIRDQDHEKSAISYVHAPNLTEIQQYAEILEHFDCYRFYPTMTDPFDVSKVNANLLNQSFCCHLPNTYSLRRGFDQEEDFNQWKTNAKVSG